MFAHGHGLSDVATFTHFMHSAAIFNFRTVNVNFFSFYHMIQQRILITFKVVNSKTKKAKNVTFYNNAFVSPATLVS